MRLFLFDVDGTLVTARGAGRAAFGRALDATYGTAGAIETYARDDALVGLLTGNVEAGARLKLASTGLWPLFRVGAFGSDDMDRRRLPAIACERARVVAGREFPFERVTIIGDTPLDVDCARACGAVAVAVATGQHPRDELAACAPDHIFTDFTDVPGAVAALTGSAR